jgi:hypothetical protein
MKSRIMDAISAGRLKVDRNDKEKWTELDASDRLSIYRRCGADCFMKPSEDKDEILANPTKALKFPVCRVPRSKKACALSASGLLAANRRARLSRQHPDVVEATRELIDTLGTTNAAREKIPVRTVRLTQMITDKGRPAFHVTVVYEDGVREILTKPLSPNLVLKRFQHVLSIKQHQRLSAAKKN